MDDAWFTDYPDELARCLVDARNCAAVCEAYLRELQAGDDGTLRRALHVLAAPAAVARVLIDLIDHPPQLILAATRMCRDLTAAAAEELGGPPEVVAALRTASASAAALLETAG